LELETSADSARRQLVLIWVAVAVSLGASLLAATLDRRPLDDPDLVFQRPGLLDANGPPFSAPSIAPNVPAPGEKLLLFFIREEQTGPLRSALGERAHPFDAALVAVAVAGQVPTDTNGPVSWIGDSDGKIAAAYRMPRPRDGGPPVGYAIVDNLGRVRYRTLDPSMWTRLDEVWTMWKATP
jgi:hypothetical protein